MNTLKSAYLKDFQITAGHFNALRIGLDGKIKAIEALRAENLKTIEGKIKKLGKAISSLEQQPKRYKNPAFQLHQKKRAFIRQQHQHDQLKTQIEGGKVSLCFGSKALFRKQFHLQENGYASHQEWKQYWQAARASQFCLIGSKDETMGNQSCVATVNDDHTLNLRLRVPDALAAQHGKYMIFERVQLHYGKDAILGALTEDMQ
ncbi:transposase, partial [bacterium]|nr:transposase [bacterium]